MINELSYAGLEVPQDITVVCFTDSYLSELSHVRITTLAHRPHEMARCAADCMLRSLQRLPAGASLGTGAQGKRRHTADPIDSPACGTPAVCIPGSS